MRNLLIIITMALLFVGCSGEGNAVSAEGTNDSKCYESLVYAETSPDGEQRIWPMEEGKTINDIPCVVINSWNDVDMTEPSSTPYCVIKDIQKPTGCSKSVDAKDMKYSEFMDSCIEGITKTLGSELPLCRDFNVEANAPCDTYSFVERDVIPNGYGINLPAGMKFYYCGNGQVSGKHCVSNPTEFCSWSYEANMEKRQ